MNITVLDGYTLNPGDLSWSPLQNLGSCHIYDRTPSEAIIPRAAEAEIVLTNKTPLHRDTIIQLPKLQYIGVLATGYNIVDISAAREQHITVSNVPSYGTQSVAQMVFALLLELTRQVAHHAVSLVDVRRLNLMKASAFLINTSRGPLIDEDALANALHCGQIAGAGLDVLSVEPPTVDNPLLKLENCFITPHIAWATQSARQTLLEITVANIQAFLQGQPQNVVN